MGAFNSAVSACRHCQFFKGEGRRGGQCQQLGVPVQAMWNACQLAIPPFVPAWESAGLCILPAGDRLTFTADSALSMPLAVSAVKTLPNPDRRSRVLVSAATSEG